jgi:hypothetical protein
MCDRTSNWRVVPEVAEHLINNSTRRLRWRHVLSPEGMFSLTPEWLRIFVVGISVLNGVNQNRSRHLILSERTDYLPPTPTDQAEGVLLPESSCATSRDRGDSATLYRAARVAIFPTAPLQDLLLSRAAGARLMKGKEVGDSGCCSQSQLSTLGVVLPSWAWSPRAVPLRQRKRRRDRGSHVEVSPLVGGQASSDRGKFGSASVFCMPSSREISLGPCGAYPSVPTRGFSGPSRTGQSRMAVVPCSTAVPFARHHEYVGDHGTHFYLF